jgi:hypothetical protein
MLRSVDEDFTYGLGPDKESTQFIVENAGEAIWVKHISKASFEMQRLALKSRAQLWKTML